MVTVIHDLHLGAIRSAGTTTVSALALRRWQLSMFDSMLDGIESDLVILGDLFDTYQIPMTDLLAAYQLLQQWLSKGWKLTLIPGNHDLSTDSSKLSSFQFMAQLLITHPNVSYIQGGGWVAESDGVYAISHVVNQDLLNLELAKVPTCRYLLVHANYDNNFAKDSDHSLNISREQIDAMPQVGTAFFAHEHSHRTADRVYVAGNQFPASISDCLDGKDKFSHTLSQNGIQRNLVWKAADYEEIDWREPKDSEAQFIRIVGSCTPEEAADMANMVVRYRKQSDAFVVGNAVKVVSDDPLAELAVSSLEDIKSFDVLGAVKNLLTARQVEILEGLA